MKNFTALGPRKVEKVTEKSCDVLVVGNGDLAKTAKLLLAVAWGKPVVRDEWVAECAKQGKVLDTSQYPAKKTWGIDLNATSGRDRCRLFAGRSLYITPALKKEYGDGYQAIQQLAKVVGFTSVTSKPARGASIKDYTVVLAKETDDLDASTLLDLGYTCYCKDLLSFSILRGELDLEHDEFKIAERATAQKSKTKRRKSA